MLLKQSFIILALSTTGAMANLRNLQKGGIFDGKFQEKDKFQDKPKRPGFVEAELVDIACSDEWACDARNGEAGTFVCRSKFNPLTGESRSKSICIPSGKALKTDECGCCGEECPELPDFTPISCEDQELDWGDSEIELERKRPDLDRPDKVAVCRELYDPFTGELTPTTIFIKADHALEGDVCGCCSGECPVRGEPQFERPEGVELDFCAAEELTSCTIPKRKQIGDEVEEETTEGVFVCRSYFSKFTGETKEKSVCIDPADGAWPENDSCGCCGDECPTKPENIECPAEEDQCEMRNGRSGVFVCRSLFHPVEGTPMQKSLCVPPERTMDIADTCGCCDGECPTSPREGFEDEDTQLLTYALEVEESIDDSSSASHVVTGVTVGFLLVGALAMLSFGL